MRILVKNIIWCSLLVMLSCGGQTKPQPKHVKKEEMKKSMERANRYLLNEEEEDIANYINRHGLEMTTTGTGLRYQVMQKGCGGLIEKGQKVVLEYELQSIAGDLFYSSGIDGVKSFVVGEGAVEAGLDEAMTYMHCGDVAKIILPFHLAYGLHGDDNRIPEYATLVYTIKIIDSQ